MRIYYIKERGTKIFTHLFRHFGQYAPRYLSKPKFSHLIQKYHLKIILQFLTLVYQFIETENSFWIFTMKISFDYFRHNGKTIFASNIIVFFNSQSILLTDTQKKDLLESKKIICLKDFLWFKKIIYLSYIKFFWFKLSIFETNENLCNYLFVLKKNLFYLNKHLFGPKIFRFN